MTDFHFIPARLIQWIPCWMVIFGGVALGLDLVIVPYVDRMAHD